MKNDRRQLRRLKALSAEPEEQAAYALAVLETTRDRQLIQESLRVLAERPYPDARPILLDLFTYYDEQGLIRDGGGYIRSAIISALRHIAQPSDVSIIKRAAMTYEFPAPAFKEDAAPLRAVGLVVLNDLDEELARFHATRVLAEEYSNPMSGEPALTAVRVLASQDQTLPIYFYASQDLSRGLPEIVSECLRHLTSLPESLVPGLLDRYSGVDDELVLAGLFDLLVTHNTGPHGRDFMLEFLSNTKRHSIYRYLAALIVASSKQEMLPDLLEIARFEQDQSKIAILIEVLEILGHKPEVAEILDKLELRTAD